MIERAYVAYRDIPYEGRDQEVYFLSENNAKAFVEAQEKSIWHKWDYEEIIFEDR